MHVLEARFLLSGKWRKIRDTNAEAFIEFAKKEKLSFFKPSPSVEPFDQTKYDRLMDGLEAVEISFSKLESIFRLDSDFYKKEHLKAEKILEAKSSNRLGDLCRLYDGPFGSELLADAYTLTGTPVLRMQNVSEAGSLELDDVQFISNEESERLNKFEAFPGDIVSTKIGFLGYSTVLTPTYKRYIFRRELTRFKINDEKSINPYYLATFFNSKFGRGQFYRYASGTTRDRVLLTSQKEVLAPTLDFNFQISIENLIQGSYHLRKESDRHYGQAEELLLSELGLNDWQPIADTIAVKRFSDSWGGCDRGDAEHYRVHPAFAMSINT